MTNLVSANKIVVTDENNTSLTSDQISNIAMSYASIDDFHVVELDSASFRSKLNSARNFNHA